MTRPTQPATPLTDAYWTGDRGAGGGAPDWNDPGSQERYSAAHAALARWFGGNATEAPPPEIEALRTEYDAVTAYLNADLAWEANPEPSTPPAPITAPPSTTVPPPATPASINHPEIAAIVAKVPPIVQQHRTTKPWWNALLEELRKAFP